MSPTDNSPANPAPAQNPAAVIVLAAGAGTRMKSQKPKILHEIGGISMVGHALAAARGLAPKVLAPSSAMNGTASPSTSRTWTRTR